MGTSRNDPSPPTPPWKPVLAVLGRQDVSVQQQVREVWRAAAQDRNQAIVRDLSHPLMSKAADLASGNFPLREALSLYDEAAHSVSQVGLAAEFGRRALVRCVSTERSGWFAAELFAEAVGYYVARDLPSVVAAKGRVSSVSEAIDLKNSIRDYVRNHVQRVGEQATGQRWREFVKNVSSTLQQRVGRS